MIKEKLVQFDFSSISYITYCGEAIISQHPVQPTIPARADKASHEPEPKMRSIGSLKQAANRTNMLAN